MFLEIIDESMINLKNSLESRYDKFILYKERIKLLPLGNDETYNNIYDLLIQATLFSEYGISIIDLIDVLKISRGTLNSRLKKLPSEFLSIKYEKRLKFYSLNLENVDDCIKKYL